MTAVSFYPVQPLLWPALSIASQREVYMRLLGPVAHSLTGRSLTFASGGEADFNTATNLFNLSKWLRYGGTTDLALSLEGEGTFELVVMQAPPERSWERLFCEPVELVEGQPILIDLAAQILPSIGGMLYFSLRALGAGQLFSASWGSMTAPGEVPRLARSISIFKHDTAVSTQRPDMTEASFFPVQPLLWPELGITTERELYMRLSGPVAHSLTGRSLTFAVGGAADFDTSANLFNLSKWQRHCGRTDLSLCLDGEGRFELVVIQAMRDRSWERVFSEPVELVRGQPFRLDFSPQIVPDVGGMLYFTLKALGPGHLAWAAWGTTTAPRRMPQLALSITTFKRETAVQASVARFEQFMARTDLAPYLHLFVVDNGRSAEIQPSQHVTPIGNENLGGSGGFSRGLLAAEARGASHCLFMDDDAAIQMEALERTWAFLAYAEDPSVAVAGGMTMANHRWSMWESGAIFDRVCRPQWLGLDLRDFGRALEMEYESTGPKPPNFYGGWWYFAFPIAQVTYRPFPFFVRGDDVSFSLANDFEIVTLPGVVCFQDADFADKESLLTLYLDLRSHMIHHLALPQMDIGRRGVVGIAARFFARSMMQGHYDTLSALNLAVSDVLRGPAFFAANADMAERRTRLGKMRQTEAWRPLVGKPPASRRRFDPRRNRVWLLVMKYSLNGLLLPFFGVWGNHVTLKSGQRGQLHEIWGASQVTCVNADGTQMFTVRHSKARVLREGLKMIANLTRLALRFPAIRAMWRKGYADLTTKGFWIKTLGIDPERAFRDLS